MKKERYMTSIFLPLFLFLLFSMLIGCGNHANRNKRISSPQIDPWAEVKLQGPSCPQRGIVEIRVSVRGEDLQKINQVKVFYRMGSGDYSLATPTICSESMENWNTNPGEVRTFRWNSYGDVFNKICENVEIKAVFYNRDDCWESQCVYFALDNDINGKGLWKLRVPQDYSTLQEAIDYLKSSKVYREYGNVVIQIDEGFYTAFTLTDIRFVPHPDYGSGKDGNLVVEQDMILDHTQRNCFKSITVKAGATLSFKKTEEPVILKIQGDLKVYGRIEVNGQAGISNDSTGTIAQGGPGGNASGHGAARGGTAGSDGRGDGKGISSGYYVNPPEPFIGASGGGAGYSTPGGNGSANQFGFFGRGGKVIQDIEVCHRKAPSSGSGGDVGREDSFHYMASIGGGSGGGSAGILIIHARRVLIEGSIEGKGGNSGTGTPGPKRQGAFGCGGAGSGGLLDVSCEKWECYGRVVFDGGESLSNGLTTGGYGGAGVVRINSYDFCGSEYNITTKSNGVDQRMVSFRRLGRLWICGSLSGKTILTQDSGGCSASLSQVSGVTLSNLHLEGKVQFLFPCSESLMENNETPKGYNPQ